MDSMTTHEDVHGVDASKSPAAQMAAGVSDEADNSILSIMHDDDELSEDVNSVLTSLVPLYCIDCGEMVEAGDEFCISCGTRVAVPPDPSGPASLVQLPDPSGPVSSAPLVLMSARLGAAIDELGEWARRWDVQRDPYVEGLSRAAATGSNMTMWANLDTHEMMPVPTVRSGRGYSRLARVITILRNVAVFVPVALTWMAINRATEVFGDYAEDRAGETVNFLQFWQSGGDNGEYLSSFWRIQHIAFLDTLIITGIVVSTLVASLFESRARAKRERAEYFAERERVRIALVIDEALQVNRSASPDSVAETLALALNNLSAATRDVNQAAHRMENATLGMESLGAQAEQLSGHMGALSQQFSVQLLTSIDDLGASVSRLGVTMGGDMQRFLTDVLSGIEEISERLSRTSVSVEFGTKMLRDDLDALHGQLSSLTNRAVR
jgi:hypothetical protein